MRVLLVSMPFAAVERPAIGLSLLKAGLARDGVGCDVLYANLAFAASLGLDTYDAVCRRGPHRSLAGDWVFAEELFGADEARSREYLRRVAGDASAEFRDALPPARAAAPAFLGSLMEEVPWGRYDVVGFTSFCEQNLAAMAMAARVKAVHPDAVIVTGGANWHGEMGVAQLRLFPSVDVAFLGEADCALRDVVSRLESGQALADVPGLAFRSGGEVVVTSPAEPVASLDELPLPDYSDYFQALREHGLEGRFSVTLGVEGSRGCWWAQRAPCRFCGLNGDGRAYRAKSAALLLEELRRLAALWPRCSVDLVDNLAPEAFVREVLPQLAETPLGVPLSFETRPDVDAGTLDLIVRAGASFQVGIESLSDHVLRMMGKGLRVVDALRLLRDCRARGLPLYWNIILGIRGETEQDHREVIGLLPAIRFLQPPATCSPLSLDRFSPYFEEYDAWGFEQVRPHEPFGLVYPVADETLWGLADSFDHTESLPLLARVARYRLRADVRAWQEDPDPGELRVLPRGGAGFSLRDTRACATAEVLDLDGLQQLVCLACEAPRTREELLALVGPGHAGREIGPGGLDAGLDAALDGLLAARVLVRAGGRYLSLALPPAQAGGAAS